jgi:hypothetical protein
VKLGAGRRYYLEVMQKQSAGSAHLSVRWRLPNGVEERPIPGSRLSPPDITIPNRKLALSENNPP